MNPLYEDLRVHHPDLLGVYEQAPAPRWRIDLNVAVPVEEIIRKLTENLGVQAS